MDNFSKIPSLKIILISLSVNLIICCTLLPLAIQPYQIFTFRQLLEIMLWQGLANIGWIIPLLFSSLAFFRYLSLRSTRTYSLNCHQKQQVDSTDRAAYLDCSILYCDLVPGSEWL